MYQRIVIYTADIEALTGKSNSYAKKLMCKIRKELNKKRTDFVDVEEFANATGINKDLIFTTINRKKPC